MANQSPRKDRSLWLLGVPMGLFGLWFLLGFIFAGYPSEWRLHRTPRRHILERVQLAGGWAALEKDCVALAEQHRGSGFFWSRGDTNALLAAIAALEPWTVTFQSPPALRDFKDQPQVPVVRIQASIHFYLEVVCAANAESYHSQFGHTDYGGDSGGTWNSSRVSDRVYEVY